MEETTILQFQPTSLEDLDLSVILGSEELTRQVQIRSLAKHGKSMLMMYNATGDAKWLEQARQDYKMAKSLYTDTMKHLDELVEAA